MSSCFILSFYFICCISIGLVTSKPLSVLLIQSIPSTSHHIWTEHLVKGLLRKGHHVHTVSVLETKIEGKLAENLTYDVFADVMTSHDKFEDYCPDQWEEFNEFYMAYVAYLWGIIKCDTVIKTKAAKELLEMIKTVEFDVIVHDVTLQQCFYGLWEDAKGKPPIVGLIPLGSAPWLKDFTGGPSYPTVRPYTSSVIAKPVGLWQTTWNTLYFMVDDLLRHYYFLPNAQRIAEKYVGHAIRPLHEIEKDSINIVLINSYCAFEPAIPVPPNTLETGGLHVQTVQPIAGDKVVTYPKNVHVFLDEAKSGAIVISLGTNVRWKCFGPDKIKAVILALSKLKQRVLWKLDIIDRDIEASFQMPDNVMTMKWIPQKEVLSHKNVKAVWMHAGLLSTQEAIWEGIPMIVTPFFMDQKSNAEVLVAKGVGIRLDFKILSTQSVLHAIEKILYNKSYTRNMKRLSSEFRDRPIPPLDLAVWSIEYTARHPNGSLATPLRSQSWMVQNLIDVYAVLFLIFFIILLSIYFLTRKLINFCYNYTYIVFKLCKSKQA
ncbi:PREDICTED: UDP-glucuronosyltransferase 2B1-like [Vollenhovia emeryi]|uniref:UDP-glucuronosyltransferase 2B1-like n=1 Tax=Vollenhovia emeryi TaxID=411798 RepID=UPI0005F53C11|nr:PREDICTED: UDP-glucuronosyltransferase 2B1-like [Vollenhovia emeryi]